MMPGLFSFCVAKFKRENCILELHEKLNIGHFLGHHFSELSHGCSQFELCRLKPLLMTKIFKVTGGVKGQIALYIISASSYPIKLKFGMIVEYLKGGGGGEGGRSRFMAFCELVIYLREIFYAFQELAKSFNTGIDCQRHLSNFSR